MSAGDIEKVLDKVTWMSAQEIALKTGTEVSSVQKVAKKLVNKWKTVEMKKMLIEHNWRSHYRLKGDKK